MNLLNIIPYIYSTNFLLYTDWKLTFFNTFIYADCCTAFAADCSVVTKRSTAGTWPRRSRTSRAACPSPVTWSRRRMSATRRFVNSSSTRWYVLQTTMPWCVPLYRYVHAVISGTAREISMANWPSLRMVFGMCAKYRPVNGRLWCTPRQEYKTTEIGVSNLLFNCRSCLLYDDINIPHQSCLTVYASLRLTVSIRKDCECILKIRRASDKEKGDALFRLPFVAK